MITVKRYLPYVLIAFLLSLLVFGIFFLPTFASAADVDSCSVAALDSESSSLPISIPSFLPVYFTSSTLGDYNNYFFTSNSLYDTVFLHGSSNDVVLEFSVLGVSTSFNVLNYPTYSGATQINCSVSHNDVYEPGNARMEQLPITVSYQVYTKFVNGFGSYQYYIDFGLVSVFVSHTASSYIDPCVFNYKYTFVIYDLLTSDAIGTLDLYFVLTVGKVYPASAAMYFAGYFPAIPNSFFAPNSYVGAGSNFSFSVQSSSISSPELNGFLTGVESSVDYEFGYNSGYREGYDTGLDDGYVSGQKAGYSEGMFDANSIVTESSASYTAGYYAGLTEGGDYSFFSLISAVVEVPVKTFVGLFDFELLGVNLLGFVMSILGVSVVLSLVRRLL